MPVTMRLDQWLNFVRTEYLEKFIQEGGAAIKFPVPLDDRSEEMLSIEVPREASSQDYLVAQVDAADTKIHLVEEIFFQVAGQIDWERVTERVLGLLSSEAGYEIPEYSEGPFVERLTAKNRIERNLALMEVRTKIQERVYKQRVLAKDFRVAMTQLSLAHLTGGEDSSIRMRTINDWLTGRNRAASAVKPYQIYNRISRANARYFLESLLQWVKFAGYPGIVILLKIARVTLGSNPHDGKLFYTTAALLDAYEVLRQFIDATDRMTGCLFVVIPGADFLNQEPMGRGLGRYEALKFRVFDEVRAQQHANPMAALVRLSMT